MSRARLRSALLSIALIASVGLVVGATETSASAAQKTEITWVSRTKPIKGEKFTITGNISTQVERKVVLQRKVKKSWVSITSLTTSEFGRFKFATQTNTKRTYRVRAPKTTIDGKTFKAKTTNSRTVKPVGQKVTLTLSRTTATVGDKVRFTADASPVRQGRLIRVKVSALGGEPFKSDFGFENTNGEASVVQAVTDEAIAGVYVYRVYVVERYGAPVKWSNEVKLTIK